MTGTDYGVVTPRLYTPPLRELTPATTNGDAFIVFCREVLGVELYPWQKWLARHAMELNADGTYRYRRVLILVGRQNGKTTLAAALSAWWLYVEAFEEPGRRPDEFAVVGVAQNLKTAAKPYNWLASRVEPKPATDEERALTLPPLVEMTRKVSKSNGAQGIKTKAGATYTIVDGKASRGDSTARLLMDEVREQHNWRAWDATSQTTKTFKNGQLWCITSGGEARSVVLHKLRAEAVKEVERAEKLGDGYADDPDADTTLGFFEWSAPEDAKPLDKDAILQANPSIGYSAMTVQQCRADYRTMTENGYRSEVLCQYVPAKTTPFIASKDFEACITTPAELRINPGERMVWAIDTSLDRQYTSIAVAVMCADGVPFVQLARDPRLGMMWAVDELVGLARQAGFHEVMLQERGCPAMEFVKPLEDKGLTVRRVPGSWFGIATGRFKDAVVQGRVRVLDQPSLMEAVAGGITRHYGETDAWDRRGSAVDIAPLVACTLALYGLENPVDVPLSAYETRGLMRLR